MEERANDLTDFEDAVDRLGADLRRWPSPLREWAGALLERSAEARALHAEAARLDAVLGELLTPPPVALGLKSRILAGATRADPWLAWFTTALWRPTAAASALLVAGFAVGILFPETPAAFDDHVMVAFSETELADFALPATAGPEEEQLP